LIPIIVLNYNGIKFLRECIDSLKEQTYPDYRIIVVDNASNDGSVDFLKKRYHDVGIIVNKTNYGFASGYNRVIKQLDSKYVALLNNDVIADRKWLNSLVDCFQSYNDVFACGSRILLQSPKGRINHAGAKVSILGGGWDEGYLESDVAKETQPYPTASACGAAMMLDRQVFLELGGFDDDFFAYFEDVDLCYRELGCQDIESCTAHNLWCITSYQRLGEEESPSVEFYYLKRIGFRWR